LDYFEDYKDMLILFNKYEVKYLVVGAYAMGNYGYSRHTVDIDLWIERSLENARNIQKAFHDFPVPYEITVDELNKKNFVLQIGIEPMRIDILTDIDGVDFSEAWHNRTNNSLFGEEIHFISIQDLINNKTATNRTKDKYDVLELNKIMTLKKK
jgi:hypothetical protein